jgi:prepilin-type N-terminal cleavage/methylation domain-containing protein
MHAMTRSVHGFTLIELMLAIAAGAFVLASLSSVLTAALQAQAWSRSANEFSYQGRFALDRMVARARATAPRSLATPAAGTTGNWFAPTTMYCRNAGAQLIETTTGDSGCAGTTVIANNVSAFTAQLPAGAGPLDSVARLSLTLSDAASGQTVTLVTSVRLGGGTL